MVVKLTQFVLKKIIMKKLPTKMHFSKLRVFLRCIFTKKRLAVGAAILLVILLIVQIFYPNDNLLPFAEVDGEALSWQTKQASIEKLNRDYDENRIQVYLNSSDKPVITTTLAKANVDIDTTEIVQNFDYPWYLRIVPTSLFWVGFMQRSSAPQPQFDESFEDYVTESILPFCAEEPVSAMLKANGAALDLVAAKSGGKCQASDVFANLRTMQPTLSADTKVTVAREEIAPTISDKTAQNYADEIEKRVGAGIALKVGDKTQTVSAEQVFSWLDFAEKDGNLQATINGERAAAWLNQEVASKVKVDAGTSEITTRDLTVVARKDGATGKALDVEQTINQLQTVVDGEANEAAAVTKDVAPTEKYTRTYSSSDAGLSALMQNFADDHAGTYGVSMIELDGQRRRAEYNGDRQFITASTYKLFVAYSLMKQIDEGKRSWASDEACFNKMISSSDNDCAKKFLNEIGHQKITNDIQAIGLTNSTFMKSDGIYTTPNNQALLAGMIATGQNFSSANQQRLISAMKGNVYRQGIPAGVSGTVADKVGFLDGLLHDTAIIYGTNGTYVLSIMTDGSSWANIAELARQIDALRAQ